jgi:hypothetical protein
MCARKDGWKVTGDAPAAPGRIPLSPFSARGRRIQLTRLQSGKLAFDVECPCGQPHLAVATVLPVAGCSGSNAGPGRAPGGHVTPDHRPAFTGTHAHNLSDDYPDTHYDPAGADPDHAAISVLRSRARPFDD